ncbi:MAG: hypothetical protein ACK5N0_05920 [Synechococcaceae cyanobacterium]
MPVVVNGNTYNVPYFEGTYNGNISRFTTAEMPWWGDSSLASTFATAIGNDLGLPYISLVGPGFAYGTVTLSDPDFGNLTQVEVYDYNLTSSPSVSAGANYATDGFYPYAIVTPQSPAPVPAPLPLFGAAAAFSATQRLRSMSRTLHRSTTAGS